MEKVFKIFVDFDGTISKEDVGEAIFREFGNKEKVNSIITSLLKDEISAKDCWLMLCDSVEGIDVVRLKNFIDKLEIDSTFKNLDKYCTENEIELIVLSDGFDLYIKRIFERENLNHLNVYCNKLEINNDNSLTPEFPYFDAGCTTSANCKRNHIINHSSDEDFTIFIGDGNSDKYTSQFCDFIFAKDDLLKFCESERITYFPYNNFNDVILKISQLKSKKRLKKRHQAELKRKEIYMTE
ncbi:MAG: MtnX-like HAD-IB family phosphatase [Ignavibacteriaceae bacterium]